jgi:hypothetical protein
MFAKREVRCEGCGTLNRVRSYSIAKPILAGLSPAAYYT